MFKNTPFEAIAKTMTDNAPKFNATAMQDAIRPMQDNLKAWGDLAQAQAQAAQTSITEAVESFKSVKEPQAAFEVMKASAENTVAMASKNLKDVIALSVEQFHSGVDAIEKSHPAPDAFAGVAKGMKAAASSMENAVESAMKNGAAAVASATPATAKKSRAA